MKKQSPSRMIAFFMALFMIFAAFPLQISAETDAQDQPASEIPITMGEEESSAAPGESGAGPDSASEAEASAPARGDSNGISPLEAGDSLEPGSMFEYDNIRYQVDTIDQGIGTVAVIGNPDEEGKNTYSGHVVVPENFSYNSIEFTVVGILPSAFADTSALTGITLPETTSFIGEFAFYGSGIKSIKIPDQVAKLERMAFACSTLKIVTLPAGLKEIAWDAFLVSSVLEFRFDTDSKDFAVEDGVLFDKKMKTLVKFPPGKSGNYTVPEGVAAIADGAFVRCYRLRALILPGKVKYTEETAFVDYTPTLIGPGEEPPAIDIKDKFWDDNDIRYEIIELAKDGVGRNAVQVTFYTQGNNEKNPSEYRGDIVVEPTVTYDGREYEVVKIGYRAFYKSPNVSSVTIPDTIEVIDSQAFRQSGISAFTIPDSVTEIGASAFLDTAISEITIPQSVAAIGESAFSACLSLTEVYLPDRLPKLAFSAFGSSVMNFFSTTGTMKNYSIHNGAVYDEYMRTLLLFPSGRTGDYSLPGGVAEIGDAAFVGCNLDSLTFSPSLREIHGYAFTGCDIKKLVFQTGDPPEIKFPYSDVGSFFRNVRPNSDPITVCVPKGCINSYMNFFTDLNGQIKYEESDYIAAPTPEFMYDGVRYEVIGTDSQTGKNLARVISNISESGESAYEGVINIPETVFDGDGHEYTVTEIRDYAFRNAYNVTGINMPATIHKIGEYAFAHTGVTDIVIPNGVACIEKGILFACSNLKTVTLPAGLIEIKPFFFESSNNGVTGFRFSKEADNFTIIDGVLFSKDKKTLVLYPSGKAVTEYAVPEGVTTIATGAFASTMLERLVLPKSLLTIENRALWKCSILQIVFHAKEAPQLLSPAPSLYNFLLDGFGNYEVDITVPYGAAEKYINLWVYSDTGWNLERDGKGRSSGKVIDGKVSFTLGESPNTGNPDDNSGRNGNTPSEYTPSNTRQGGNPDNSNNAQNSTNSLTSTFRSLQAQLNNAIAASNRVGSNVSRLRITNISELSLNTIRQLAAEARKYGKSCLIDADTMDKGAVMTRISFYAHEATGDVLLSGSVNSSSTAATKALFEKYFDNRVAIISLAQQGRFGMTVFIAAKPDLTGMNLSTLYFYSYNRKTNSYSRIQIPRAFFDSNKFLRFSTSLAGDIIITDKPLALRGSR